MSIMLIAAAAVAAGYPSLPSLQRALNVRNLSISAVALDQSAMAFVRVSVDPTGRVTRCDLAGAEGSRLLLDRMCPSLLRNRLKPARTPNGVAAPAYIERTIRIIFSENARGREMAAKVFKPEGDVTLEVASLPGGSPMHLVEVVTSYDAAGRMTACAADSDGVPSPMALIRAACSFLRPLKPSAIRAVALPQGPFVTNYAVRFRVAPPSR